MPKVSMTYLKIYIKKACMGTKLIFFPCCNCCFFPTLAECQVGTNLGRGETEKVIDSTLSMSHRKRKKLSIRVLILAIHEYLCLDMYKLWSFPIISNYFKLFTTFSSHF